MELKASNSYRTIVVVDDDQAVRNSLKFTLEIEGFAVRAYEHGEQLLADATMPGEGCLVIDYRLPAMDGLELLKKLRARQVQMPAFLITSHSTPRLSEQAASVGATIVEKPILGNVLVAAIHRSFVH